MSKLKSRFPKAVYERNAEIYKIMANSKRLEILNLLRDRECTVMEIADVLGIRVPNTSQHLTILKSLRLVKVRRDGQKAYYSITDPKIVEPCKIFKDLWSSKRFNFA